MTVPARNTPKGLALLPSLTPISVAQQENNTSKGSPVFRHHSGNKAHKKKYREHVLLVSYLSYASLRSLASLHLGKM